MKSDTLFMNISSDEVVISDGGMDTFFLHRNDVEKVLGPKLVQLMREGSYKNVIVLNGPGGFTNLRVGTLCLNILNTLLKNKLSFYDIPKIELYKKGYEKGILPKYGVIYIGQKRNIRLRDFERNEKMGQYSFDELKEKIVDSPVFLDGVFDDSYYPNWLDEYVKIKISFDGSNLTIDNNGKIITFSIEELNLKLSKSIAPNYMMDPSITLSNK